MVLASLIQYVYSLIVLHDQLRREVRRLGGAPYFSVSSNFMPFLQLLYKQLFVCYTTCR
jgi:hypothetical protein